MMGSDNAPLTVLMPAAGAGSRFAAAGETRPKPLIDVLGRPMAVWALSCVTKAWPDCRVIVVTLRAHETAFGISHVLREHLPKVHIVTAETITGGSLQTCLLADDVLGNGRLIVLDCDLVFRSTQFVNAVNAMNGRCDDAQGVLLSFSSQEPRFSYAEASHGRVIRTAEKQVISDHALGGAYAFANAADFVKLASEIVKTNARVANGEFYISEVYNRFIGKGALINLTQVDDYWSLGTPEEFEFCRHSLQFSEFLKFL